MKKKIKLKKCDIDGTKYPEGKEYICPTCYGSSGGKYRKGW